MRTALAIAVPLTISPVHPGAVRTALAITISLTIAIHPHRTAARAVRTALAITIALTIPPVHPGTARTALAITVPLTISPVHPGAVRTALAITISLTIAIHPHRTAARATRTALAIAVPLTIAAVHPGTMRTALAITVPLTISPVHPGTALAIVVRLPIARAVLALAAVRTAVGAGSRPPRLARRVLPVRPRAASRAGRVVVPVKIGSPSAQPLMLVETSVMIAVEALEQTRARLLLISRLARVSRLLGGSAQAERHHQTDP